MPFKRVSPTEELNKRIEDDKELAEEVLKLNPYEFIKMSMGKDFDKLKLWQKLYLKALYKIKR